MRYRCGSLMFAVITAVVMALTLAGRSMAHDGLPAEQSEQIDANAERGALDPLEKIDVHQRVIEVVLFRPEGEVGARVLVNLAQNSVANVQRLDSRQVPFTPDDLKDAFQLALREPQVQRALGSEAQSFHIQGQRSAPPAEPSENVVSGLPIRSSDPKDPCSKHRCLQLFFRRGTDFLSEPVVTVDLTAKHVSVERGKSK